MKAWISLLKIGDYIYWRLGDAGSRRAVASICHFRWGVVTWCAFRSRMASFRERRRDASLHRESWHVGRVCRFYEFTLARQLCRRDSPTYDRVDPSGSRATWSWRVDMSERRHEYRDRYGDTLVIKLSPCAPPLLPIVIAPFRSISLISFDDRRCIVYRLRAILSRSFQQRSRWGISDRRRRWWRWRR